MKKIVTFLLSLTLAFCGFAFIGCTPVKKSTTDADSYTLNFGIDSAYESSISMLIPNGVTEKGMIDSLISGFNEKFPKIKVTYEYMNIGSYESTIRNKYMSKDLNDIIWTNSPDFAYLVNNDLVYSLDEYIRQAELADDVYGFGSYNFEEDFYMKGFDYAKIDGKRYAFPRSMDSIITFVNTKITRAAGVEDSEIHDGWTWDEFMAVATKVEQYMHSGAGKAEYGENYVLDANLPWAPVMYPILRSHGADVVDSNQKVLIDSAETRAALDMIREDLLDSGVVCPTNKSPKVGFEGGGSAFYWQSAAVSLMADKKELKGNLQIVSFPLIGDKPFIGGGLAGYAINKDCKDKDACFALMSYMLSEEGQDAMAAGGNNLAPINKKVATDTNARWRSEFDTRGINMNGYLYGMEYKIGQDFVTCVNAKFKADLVSALSSLAENSLNPGRTVEECIAKVVKELKDAFVEI